MLGCLFYLVYNLSVYLNATGIGVVETVRKTGSVVRETGRCAVSEKYETTCTEGVNIWVVWVKFMGL